MRFIRTRTVRGRYTFGAMDPSEIEIGDIAHSLSMINRFTGRTREPYSVAAHSVGVAELVRRRGGTKLEQLLGLMHDASEAFVSDLSGPAKEQLRAVEGRERSTYDLVEREAWLSVATALDLPSEIPEIVHRADKDLCDVEGSQLVRGWEPSIDVYAVEYARLPIRWSWGQALRGFLAAWENLR